MVGRSVRTAEPGRPQDHEWSGCAKSAEGGLERPMWAGCATLKNVWIGQRSARRRTFDLRDQDTGAAPERCRGSPCTPGMRRLAVECAWFGMRAASIGTMAPLVGE